MAGARPGSVARGPLSKRIRFGWLLEAVGFAVCYETYNRARDAVIGSSADAFRNARAVIRIETWLGLYHEHTLQQLFLDYPLLVTFWNVYYGTAHFAVPLFAGIYLYVKYPVRYVRWRNTFLFMLALGCLGWLLFPLMPPRYLPERYGFVDTSAEYYNFGPQRPLVLDPDGQPSAATIAEFGNIYAAMPSHHVSWAIWAVLALWPVVRRRWLRALLVAHLVLTFLSIVVTGSHAILDVFGSVGELALAYAGAVGVDRLLDWFRTRRGPAVADAEVVAPNHSSVA